MRYLFLLVALFISGCVSTSTPYGYEPNITVNSKEAQLFLNDLKHPKFSVWGWSEAPIAEFSMAINFYAARATVENGYSHFVLLEYKRTPKGNGNKVRAKFLALKGPGTHNGRKALNAKQLLKQLRARASIQQVGPKNKINLFMPTTPEAKLMHDMAGVIADTMFGGKRRY